MELNKLQKIVLWHNLRNAYLELRSLNLKSLKTNTYV